MNRKIVVGVRIIFGLLLVAMGSMAFMNFPISQEMPEASRAFAQALADTGYMNYFTGIVEILVGLMFVTRRYVALGAILLAPISVNIILFHIFLDLTTIVPGLILTALNIFVAYSEWGKYREVLKAK